MVLFNGGWGGGGVFFLCGLPLSFWSGIWMGGYGGLDLILVVTNLRGFNFFVKV